jgi:anti-sigma regulatory factor (Ser/Thr protein kinase)
MTASRSLLVPEAGLADLATIRSFVREEALAFGMDAEAVQDLVLVVDEAAANILRHGYAGRPGPVEIEVSGDVHEVVVWLRDEAPSFDPTTWPTPDLDVPLERRPAGGMGIHLARLCVDRMVHRPLPGVGNELVLALSLSGKGDDGHEDHR